MHFSWTPIPNTTIPYPMQEESKDARFDAAAEHGPDSGLLECQRG